MNKPTLPSWMKSTAATIKPKFDDFNDFVAACEFHGGEQSGHPACNVKNYRFDLRAPEDRDDDPPEAIAWLAGYKAGKAA